MSYCRHFFLKLVLTVPHLRSFWLAAPGLRFVPVKLIIFRVKPKRRAAANKISEGPYVRTPPKPQDKN
jgi:hypothetical protein